MFILTLLIILMNFLNHIGTIQASIYLSTIFRSHTSKFLNHDIFMSPKLAFQCKLTVQTLIKSRIKGHFILCSLLAK